MDQRSCIAISVRIDPFPPGAPASSSLVDVRRAEDFASHPTQIVGARRCLPTDVWRTERSRDRPIGIYSRRGTETIKSLAATLPMRQRMGTHRKVCAMMGWMAPSRHQCAKVGFVTTPTTGAIHEES
jgi:hypothetical protein